jgi:hypothetical protein
MLDKLLKAFGLLKEDVTALKESVAKLEKVHPIVKEGKPGRDGKDGESPSVEDIVQAVVAQLPEPEKVDTQAIVDDVVAQIPKPRDGRDAPTVNVSDVAAIVLAKIEKPKDGKDGRNGPDLETVVKRVKAQVQDGERGEPGPPGPPGKPGKDGVSVTDVQLNNNDLFVFLDGKKRKAGTIKVPTATAPFNPGNAGGGGRAVTGVTEDVARIGLIDYNDAATQTTPINIPSGLVNVDIPNDGLGPFTNKNFRPKGVSEVWDADSGLFDWTDLNLGDMVDLRLDLSVTTTSPNQTVIVELVLAIGGFEYAIPFVQANVKTTGTYPVNRYNGVYMGDENTLLNGAKFRIRSDSAATMVVNGWYCKLLLRGPV